MKSRLSIGSTAAIPRSSFSTIGLLAFVECFGQAAVNAMTPI
jgi:hypothetical protein